MSVAQGTTIGVSRNDTPMGLEFVAT